MKPVQAFFFRNGSIATFNESGEQMPELQLSAIYIYLERVKSQGHDPVGMTVTTPDGSYTVCEKDPDLPWPFKLKPVAA